MYVLANEVKSGVKFSSFFRNNKTKYLARFRDYCISYHLKLKPV